MDGSIERIKLGCSCEHLDRQVRALPTVGSELPSAPDLVPSNALSHGFCVTAQKTEASNYARTVGSGRLLLLDKVSLPLQNESPADPSLPLVPLRPTCT